MKKVGATRCITFSNEYDDDDDDDDDDDAYGTKVHLRLLFLSFFRANLSTHTICRRATKAIIYNNNKKSKSAQ